VELAGLVTEQRRPDLADLDLRGTLDLAELMATDQVEVIAAVRTAAPDIAAAVDVAVRRLRSGGRLIYVGAGTAGRLGVLDASECPPTFNTEAVVGVLAGGMEAFLAPQESIEDDAEAGTADLARLAVGAADTVVGVAASGRTPYTIGAVDHAQTQGALTIGVACNPDAELSGHVDHPIEVVVGPEIIAGSTRLKAGTAQKIVLNTLSTLAMIRLGKTFGNLMVDVRATNAKLRQRARHIVVQATGADPAAVDAALTVSDGDVKVAIVMLLTGSDAAAAGKRLAAQHGVVRGAVGRPA
jgi:N-acetylmuramic acid 6-phosphate etherase